MGEVKVASFVALPACSFCGGSGKTGIPSYMVVCSVCRGGGKDPAALREWRDREDARLGATHECQIDGCFVCSGAIRERRSEL